MGGFRGGRSAGRSLPSLPLLDSMEASTEALDTRSYLPGLYESISPDLMRWYVLFRPWQSSKPKNFDPQFRKKDVIKSAITTLTNTATQPCHVRQGARPAARAGSFQGVLPWAHDTSSSSS